MAVDELAGESFLVEELEAGLGGAPTAPRWAAAAMAGPVGGPAGAGAQPLGLRAWRPTRNGNCCNGLLT